MSWKSVKLELIGMAGAFNININEATIGWYYQALQHLDPEKVYTALKQYGRTTKQKSLPTPAHIEELINPKVNQESEARDAASRIVYAISKFGYTNSNDAKNYIGELGWLVVERFGGWGYLCEKLGAELQLTTMFAQMRDVAMALYDRSSKGTAHTGPALPKASEKVVSILSGMVKRIE